MFIRLDKTRDGRTDRQTDGQNRCGYYNGLHCEQSERAVKHVAQLSQRDRAAGWVSCGQWKTIGRQYR